MRHGHVRRESLLYVVVVATRPRYCGVFVIAALWLTGAMFGQSEAAAAQKTRKKPPAPPFAALFPLEAAWALTLPSTPAAPAARDAMRVYVALTSNALVALDWERGGTLWSVPLSASAAPLPAEGTLYVATGDDLHALDAATGATRWTNHAERSLRILVRSESRIIGLGSGLAQAFDAASGRMEWTQLFPDAGDPVGAVIAGGALFVVFDTGRVTRLALADGHAEWTQTITGRPSPPLVVKDSIYVGSTDKRFYALDARNGKPRWTWRTGGHVTGAAAAADAKAVFYTSLDAVVRAVNPGNGHQRWKRDAGTRAPVGPIALDGSVLVTGLSPTLSAFDPLSGTPLGSLPLPGEVYGTPLVTDVLTPRRVAMVVILRDGRVYGLRALTLQFNEAAPQPLAALPGQALARERLPAPPVTAPSGTGR